VQAKIPNQRKIRPVKNLTMLDITRKILNQIGVLLVTGPIK